DKGSEFYNKLMKDFLSKNNIQIYSVYGDNKSPIVERLNRTIKQQLWIHFDTKYTNRWIDIIDKIVSDYNNKIHSTTKLTPIDASKKENEQYLLELQEKRYNKIVISTTNIPKYKINDKVRISLVKNKLQKGYESNWSREIYTICGIKYSFPVMYYVMDYNNEIIDGAFYEQELLKTELTDDKRHYIIRSEERRVGK